MVFPFFPKILLEIPEIPTISDMFPSVFPMVFPKILLEIPTGSTGTCAMKKAMKAQQAAASQEGCEARLCRIATFMALLGHEK